MPREAGKARAGLEAGEAELVGEDHGETDERHLQRVMVKQRHAGEGQTEEHEIDRHAERDARGGNHDRAGEQPALALEEPYDDRLHLRAACRNSSSSGAPSRKPSRPPWNSGCHCTAQR